MKIRIVAFFSFILLCSLAYAQKKPIFKDRRLLRLIPEPNQLVDLNNNFLIKSSKFKTHIKGLEKEFQFFSTYLEKEYNFKIQPSNSGSIVFILLIDTALQSTKQEAYTLYINQDSITIMGKNTVGVFRGLQTLIQLFPFEKKTFQTFSLPCVSIIDEPRFDYRGNHLDVVRHFFPAAYIKKYIDWLAWYKYNYFHWHLTDDQGWRIEIKSLPKLQSIAAYRDETLIGHYRHSTQYDGKRYGGYYTQEEIKNIVQYASDRFITVIPEIEMPGHALAALSAYPELGCKDTLYKAGTTWGVFEDVFCAGNEKTYLFLEKILDEVCDLFPSHYIHIGGDECPTIRWENCVKCQAKIKAENLKNEEGLQSYLIRRMEKYLHQKERIIIGWDEILDGGVSKKAIVMSWRGETGGIRAAQSENRVIMSPSTYWYLDYSEKNIPDSLVIGGFLPLEKVYNYDVIPKELSLEQQKNIIGGQSNVWTEYIDNTSKLEYMLFPRLAAVAECLWTENNIKNYNHFLKKIVLQFNLYQQKNTNYNNAALGINYYFNNKQDTFYLTLKTASYKNTFLIKINDNPLPVFSQKNYLDIPIQIFGKYNIKLVDEKNIKIDELNLNINNNYALGKEIIWIKSSSMPYKGNGKYSLVDGVSSNAENIHDKQWMGFKGDAEFYIDLKYIKNIKNIKAHFKSAPDLEIYPPKDFFVETSIDGNIFNFKPLEILSEEKGDFTKNDWWKLSVNTQARYLKITFKNMGKIPNKDKQKSNNTAWLFVDELQVN